MTPIERVRPARPLTERQARMVEMLSDGLTYYAIARHLGCGERSVRTIVERVASRIPGNLAPAVKCVVWWRGASLMVLMGCRLQDDSRGATDAA